MSSAKKQKMGHTRESTLVLFGLFLPSVLSAMGVLRSHGCSPH